MKRLISAFVFSRLDYCNGILSGLPLSTIAPLQRVQNAAARLVLGLSRSDHVRPALRELHWLPVLYRIKFKLALVMFTIYTHQCPTDSVHPYSNNDPAPYRLRSATGDTGTNYSVPRTRTKFGDRAVAGPVVWNSLPVAVRHADSLHSFKCRLKSHFLACVLMIDSVMPFRFRAWRALNSLLLTYLLTYPPDCPFLPHVLPTSDSGTRRTACKSEALIVGTRNDPPAACCDINRVVRHCCRRRSAASQRNEGARSHPRSAPDFREARYSNCAIVQLPQPSHPPHSLSADDPTCTDALHVV